MLDNVSRAFFDLKYDNRYSELKGNAFQDFFTTLMEKAYPGDFIRVRPWGRQGDRKNDGYLSSDRRLFQVYAPNEMTSSEAIRKIDEDFIDALPYWGKYFDKWTFVHNSISGLGPEVTAKLLELKQKYPDITIEPWGREELRAKVFSLDCDGLTSLLGHVPTQRDLMQVRFEQLIPILKRISCAVNPVGDIKPVPHDKLEKNALSGSVCNLLTAGMIKAPLVREYLDGHPNPNFGGHVEATFRQKYEELKAKYYSPDQIFTEFQVFVGGSQFALPEEQVATLAVLAYLFESCIIFERPEEEQA